MTVVFKSSPAQPIARCTALSVPLDLGPSSEIFLKNRAISEKKEVRRNFELLRYLGLWLFAAVIFGSGVVCGHFLFPKTETEIRDYPVAVPVPNDPPDIDTFRMYRT